MNDPFKTASKPASQTPTQGGDAATAAAFAEALQQAERLELAGKMEQAERAYRSLHLDYPWATAPLHNLALLHRQRGNLAEAEGLLLRALAAGPHEAILHNSLGVVLQSADRAEEARICYERAIELQPNYAEAHYNLGVLMEQSGHLDVALAAYNYAVRLQPRYARARTRIGVLLEQGGAAIEALAQLDQAVAAAPQYFDAHYHRGAVLSKLQRHEDALAAFHQARKLRPDSHEALLASANVLRDCGRNAEALDAYWRALERQPGDLATHEELNKLAWSSGRGDLFLRSFDYARQKLGPLPGLLYVEAAFQLRREEFAAAEQLLWKARARAPQRGDIHGLLARALVGQGRYEEAYGLFTQAISLEPQILLHQHQLGLALLRDGQAQEAREVLEGARKLEPFNQLVLSALSLAYRELGDSRYQQMFSAPRYIRTYEIKPPSGYADGRAFNQALARELDAMHTARIEPIDQTLRGGTQTSGRLFGAAVPQVQELRAAISEAVADYIRALPADTAHPMSQRSAGAAEENFGYIGSWSCRLASQGYHSNHVHPMGWISSAYYARLPEDVADAKRRPGWLKFGESNLGLGGRDRPELYVKPEVGRLVLFPSFFWHGTVPFADSHDRLSVAFDVVPLAANPLSGQGIAAA